MKPIEHSTTDTERKLTSDAAKVTDSRPPKEIGEQSASKADLPREIGASETIGNNVPKEIEGDRLDNQNDVPETTDNVILRNQEQGRKREVQVEGELIQKYPANQGFVILPEQYLRDETGNIVTDPDTGEKRRVDFVVLQEGVVVDSVEVTSETAPKEKQMAKEERIRNAGGNFIKYNNSGTMQLCIIPDDLKTRIERRE